MSKKLCSICKIEKGLLNFSFYWHKKVQRKVLRSYCDTCNSTQSKKWKKNNRDKQYKYSRNWIKRNKEKKKAHNKVWYEISKGRLIRKNCEICGEKGQAHHTNYSKPLDIIWLCRKHHKNIHKK